MQTPPTALLPALTGHPATQAASRVRRPCVSPASSASSPGSAALPRKVDDYDPATRPAASRASDRGRRRRRGAAPAGRRDGRRAAAAPQPTRRSPRRLTPETANASSVPPVAASQPVSRPPSGPGAVEGEVVEADHAAAQVIGGAELERRVRVRRPEREAEAGDQRAGARRRRPSAPARAGAGRGRTRRCRRAARVRLARPSDAETSAPASAPAPKHAESTPNTSGRRSASSAPAPAAGR